MCLTTGTCTHPLLKHQLPLVSGVCFQPLAIPEICLLLMHLGNKLVRQTSAEQVCKSPVRLHVRLVTVVHRCHAVCASDTHQVALTVFAFITVISRGLLIGDVLQYALCALPG